MTFVNKNAKAHENTYHEGILLIGGYSLSSRLLTAVPPLEQTATKAPEKNPPHLTGVPLWLKLHKKTQLGERDFAKNIGPLSRQYEKTKL